MSNHQKNLVIFGAVLLLVIAGMQACMKFNGDLGPVPVRVEKPTISE